MLKSFFNFNRYSTADPYLAGGTIGPVAGYTVSWATSLTLTKRKVQ